MPAQPMSKQISSEHPDEKREIDVKMMAVLVTVAVKVPVTVI